MYKQFEIIITQYQIDLILKLYNNIPITKEEKEVLDLTMECFQDVIPNAINDFSEF